MPVVKFGARRVEVAPLPGVRATAAETPESTGVRLQQERMQAGETLSQLGGVIARVGGAFYEDQVRRQRVQADDTALLAAENQLSKWENDRLYNPQTGAKSIKGKDAMPLPEQVGAEYEKVAGDVALGLKTDRQRRTFNKVRSDRAVNLDLTLRRHVFGEMQAYAASELEDGVKNGVNDAVSNALDLGRVKEELQRVTAKITVNGPHAGMSPAAVTTAVRAAQSQIHLGVISNLLANHKDAQAKAYFDETRSQIAGDKLDEVTQALDVSSTLGEAQKAADAILRAGGTLTEQRDRAKGIEDPEVRREALAQIEHEAAVDDKVQRDTEERTLRGVYDAVDRTHSITSIPRDVWAALDGSTRSAIRSYAKSLAENGPGAIKTDAGTLYTLLTLSSTNEDAFLKTNLLKYKNTLSAGDLEQMMRMQATMRTGQKGGENLFVSEKAQGQIIDSMLGTLGFDVTPTELKKHPELGEQRSRFLRMVREATTRQEQRTGKKATDTEIQSIVDTLAAPVVGTKKGWFFSSPTVTPAFDVAQAQVQSLAEVPAAEQRLIRRALAAKGLPATDRAILELFNRQLQRVRGDR